MKSLFSHSTIQTTWRVLRQTMLVLLLASGLLCVGDLAAPQTAHAYPFWAQQNYDSPREATGRIVCANCHLAAKPTKIEVPQAVLPDTVFKAVVEVPYDTDMQQVLGDGSKAGLNVGAVLILPDGFRLAPEDRLSEELKEETEGVYFQEYSEEAKNILLVGPLPGEEHQEIVFPILSPDPANDKSVNFGKYAVHVGGNRGRGQVYPTGEASNNNVIKASVAGVVDSVKTLDFGSEVVITTDAGEAVVETIPPGTAIIVEAGTAVAAGESLTTDPNVGGFGQMDTEIVLQSGGRIAGLLAFFTAVMLAQILLVLKKKQVEKVQAAELNF